MDKLLVSACLLGEPCRYDGRSKADARVLALAEKYELIPVCPEQLGGLPTPRVPSERSGERVITADGRARTVRKKRLRGCRAQGKKSELRLRADLRRHVFPPFDRGRRCDSGAPQGARHCHLRRKRAGSDAGGHGCAVRSQIK